MNMLKAGTILRVLDAAGHPYHRKEKKAVLRCPFHKDRHPSAVAFFDTNIFKCDPCGLSIGAKELAERLGVDWQSIYSVESATGMNGQWDWKRQGKGSQAPSWPPEITITKEQTEKAWLTWETAVQFTRQKPRSPFASTVVGYLEGRGLLPALDREEVGILSPSAAKKAGLPEEVLRLVAQYPVVCPLWRVDNSDLGALQFRAINKSQSLRLMFPEDWSVVGTVFANARGRDMLSGCGNEDDPAKVIVFAEGLADFLTFCLTCDMPVFGCPGTSFAAKSIGPWIGGRRVLIAMDMDGPGQKVAPAVARPVRYHGGEPFKITWPPGCDDANDALNALGIEKIRKFVLEVLHG